MPAPDDGSKPAIVRHTGGVGEESRATPLSVLSMSPIVDLRICCERGDAKLNVVRLRGLMYGLAPAPRGSLRVARQSAVRSSAFGLALQSSNPGTATFSGTLLTSFRFTLSLFISPARTASASPRWFFREAGGFSGTPARRALLKPIAMACCGDRAPCLPSRTCSISSRTNSPAAVDADFPSRRSSVWLLLQLISSA